MRKRTTKLDRIVQVEGEDAICELVNDEQSVIRAATHLNVAPNTLYTWLRRNGYRPVQRLVWKKVITQ